MLNTTKCHFLSSALILLPQEKVFCIFEIACENVDIIRKIKKNEAAFALPRRHFFNIFSIDLIGSAGAQFTNQIRIKIESREGTFRIETIFKM